jgi:thiol-disulfide isomerase/thioredoxin
VGGLFTLGSVAAIGALGGGVVWLLTGAFAPALHLTSRMALFGMVMGGALALCRWLCGGACDRLITVRIVKGDIATLGALLGLVLAGYLAERLVAAVGENEPRLAIGQAMDISGPTLDGGHFDLADHRGKVVLVDFWATWCGPCVAELPNVRAAYDKYHGDGLEVVSVSFDFERSALVKFLETNPTPWPQIFFDGADTRGWENPLGRRYGIRGIPCLLVIDREGKLAARNVRGKQISTAVAGALGQPVSWGDRLVGGGSQTVGWFFYGIMAAPVWLVLLCGLGSAALGAAAEVAVRRSFARPAPAGRVRAEGSTSPEAP